MMFWYLVPGQPSGSVVPVPPFPSCDTDDERLFPTLLKICSDGNIYTTGIGKRDKSGL